MDEVQDLDDDDNEITTTPEHRHAAFQLDIKERCLAAYLDWDKIDEAQPSVDQLVFTFYSFIIIVEFRWNNDDQRNHVLQ